MDINESEKTLLSSNGTYKTIASSSATASATEQSNNIRLGRGIFENSILICLYPDNDKTSDDYRDDLAQLRSIINIEEIFTDPKKCLGFLTETKDEQIIMIILGTQSEQILPLIHDVQQLDSIYLFCRNDCGYEHLMEEWSKVRSIHTKMSSLSATLQKALKQCDQDSMSISFVPISGNISTRKLDQLEPSFMYTQILKEIFLEIEYDEQSVKDLVVYWRSQYAHNDRQLNVITEFERDYTPQSSIWWYTRTYFTYHVLNRALRNLEAEAIIKMSFFICDLHQQIQQLHAIQFGSHHVEPFIVYRGQGLSISDFEKLKNTMGGLMSFNNFLSTSKTPEVSLLFSEGGLTRSDSVGILFKITIDPSISSAPFAFIDDVSYFQTEHEVLFSMHTVFRIGEIKKLDDDKELYQVELKLTNDSDEQLRILSERIRQEAKGSNGWERLGDFLIILNQFDMAEQLHRALLEREPDESKKVKIYNQLGQIKRSQGDFKEALSYYKKAIESFEKNFPSNDLGLAASYNNIGSLYRDMSEYSIAFQFHEKALEIGRRTLPPDHLDLGASYFNIGKIYGHIGEYAKALSFYEKALEIQQQILPPNHPKLAISYNNIGRLFYDIREFSKALLFYEKALEIRQQSRPSNHPELAYSYDSIARMYIHMKEYTKALSLHEKALEIFIKTFPPNHSDLATSYNFIGGAYYSMKKYSTALLFYEKAIKIRQQNLPSNHPDLGICCDNIGLVYENMGDYSKAMEYFTRAVDIMEKSLPSNHRHLVSCKKNLEDIIKKLQE